MAHRVLLRTLVRASCGRHSAAVFTRSALDYSPVLREQPARFISAIQKYGVKVVNIKKREDAQTVYPDLPGEQQPNRTVSTTSENRNSDNQSTKTPDSANPVSGNMAETVVGNVADFKDGQMQEVEVGDKKVLLVKEDGQFYALANKCTHYGAPLSKGAYCKGVVRCPWHGACFNIKTGDIEDYPGLDSVPTFQVEVKGDKVVVKADPAALENTKRVKPMVKRAASNKESVVIVGGGPASVVCAETLRQEGYTGKVTIVSQETCLPYDRIKLSKALGIKPEEIALRKQEFYDEHGIDMVLGKQVTKVEPENKKIILDDGLNLKYDSLVLATGGKPRVLPIPGSELKNVYILRTPQDANAIADNAMDKNVVIIGSSFIGLEVATYMVGKAATVNVIGQSACPLAHVFGPNIGQWLRKLHESKGVKFHFETSVKEFRGDGGHLKEAVLMNGTVLPADVCVMGVGVVPATDFLKDSGLSLTQRGFVSVNKNMKTNLPGVYAAGDIVEFPLFTADDQNVNVQHWQMAHQHGKIAALSIAGKAKEIRSVPYFWTVQFGKSIRYTGYGPGYDDVILHGELDDNKFVAYYTKKDQVVAVASLGWDPIVSQAAELMANGGTISKSEIKSDPASWLSRLTSA